MDFSRFLARLSWLSLLTMPVPPLAAQDSNQTKPAAIGEGLRPLGRFDFAWEPESDLDMGGRFSYWDIRVNTPIWMTELGRDWLLGAVMRYRFSEINWEGQTYFLNDDFLHRIDLNLALLYHPQDSPWLGLLAAGPALATNGGRIDSDDWMFVAIAGVGYRFSKNFTLLGAAYLSEDFGDLSVIPVPGFSWRISEQWDAFLVPPWLRITWKPNSDWRFAAEANTDGSRWSVADLNGDDAYLDRRVIRAGLRVERRLIGNGWLYASGGWMFARELSVETSSEQTIFESDAEAAPYLGAGFVWRF